MKFADVKIGQIFKTEYYTNIKTPNFEYHGFDGTFEYGNCVGLDDVGVDLIADNTEVELISNCANCKYCDLAKADYETDFCDKLNTGLTGEYYFRDQDVQTFSCSHWEAK
jgi:hypothetical protein